MVPILTGKLLKSVVIITDFSAIDENDVISTAETLAALSTPFATYAAVKLMEPTIDQYKSYTFAKVKQSTTRKIGKALVEKLFGLDHAFHTNRETGAILKVVIFSKFIFLRDFHAIQIFTLLRKKI